VQNKLVEAKKEENKNLKNELHKEEKLKENLDLIKNKIIKIQANNITDTVKNGNHTIAKNNTNSTKNKPAVKNTTNNEEEINLEMEDSEMSGDTPSTPNAKTSSPTNASPDKKRKIKYSNSHNTQKKQFRYFDQIQISRFLEQGETKHKLKQRKLPIMRQINKENVENDNLEDLALNEKDLKNKLDLVTFDNINKSRNIYQSLEGFEDNVLSLHNSKNICEVNLKRYLSENLELKEALAELEIKFRLSRARKLN
jgi:hypothetical protein